MLGTVKRANRHVPMVHAVAIDCREKLLFFSVAIRGLQLLHIPNTIGFVPKYFAWKRITQHRQTIWLFIIM